MRQKYTKVEELWPAVQAKKSCGQTNRSIAEELGLTLKHVKKLVTRQKPEGPSCKQAVHKHNNLLQRRFQ